MRIGIEAQRLYRAHKHGMDRVALELIRNLQVLDKTNEYFIFVKPDVDNKVISNTSNFKIVEIEGGSYPIWEQVKLPKAVANYNCDLLHCTSNTAPIASKIPLITTLHDVIFKEETVLNLLKSSASWYQKIGNLYRRLIVSKVVKKSNKLITVSNYEKDNLKKWFSTDDKNLHTIHNGVNQNFKPSFSEESKIGVKEKYNLPEDFILHIANTDPRKNTKRVLEAFNNYTKTKNEAIKLVLVGVNETKLSSILESTDLETQIKDNVILTGYVSDEDLPVIFNLAKLFLFPSLREGFGIPIIEAMASGVPVITSNSSSMPEVAGDAAVLINPNKTQEITNAIDAILSDIKLRNVLVIKGLKRAKNFSWQNTANKVLEQYKELFNEQKSTKND